MSKKNKNSPTALLEDDAPSAFLSKTFGILEVNVNFKLELYFEKNFLGFKRNELINLIFALLLFQFFFQK